MPNDSEILIKVASDVSNALAGMTALAQSMTETVAAVKAIGETSEQSGQQSQTFFDGLNANAEASGAATVAMGVTMSKAFEQVGEVLGTIVSAFPQMISAAADAGDEALVMANRLNTTVEKLDELQFIANAAGGDVDGLAKTIQGLGSTLADSGSKSAKAITDLGLSLDDLQAQDPTAAFTTIIETLQTEFPDAAQRSVKAMEIFGNRFGANSALLNENIGELRANFDKLGPSMTTEFAKNSDAYNAAWDAISHKQDQFRNQVVNSVLPTLTSLLEQFPALGGAAVTLGGSLFAMGEQLVPLISNIGLLASSGLGPWLKTTAMALPGVTTAVNALGLSFKGLTAALGPLAIAIAGVTAAWYVWGKANEESGFFRDRADDIQWAAMRLMGWSDAAAEAEIAAQHAREKAAALAAATAATGDAAAKAAPQIRAQKDGFAELAKETAKNREALAALTTAQRSQIASALAQGQSLQDISDLTKVSAGALELFQKQIAATKQASESSPLGKFVKEMETFGPSVAAAVKSGAPMADMVAQFGKHAAELVTKAKLIPGAFAAVPQAVRDIATAFTSAEFQKAMDAFEKKTGDIADLWKNVLPDAIARVDADLMASLQAVTTMQDNLTRSALSGTQQRLAAIDKEEQAAIAAAKKRLTAGTELSQRELDLIRQTYDEKRALEQKYTGNVLRDAEMRGYKSREELQKTAAVERQVLADMLASREYFTSAEIAAQEETVERAEVAAGKVTTAWSTAFDGLTQAFAQLAQISGDTFGGILKGTGQAIGAFNVMAKGLTGAFGKDGFGSITKAFSDVRADGGSMISGITASLGKLGPVISGVMAAATVAVEMGKKVWDAFTKSSGEKAAREVGRDFGVAISEEMGNAIAKTAKEQFGGDRFAASLVHMGDIVKEAGGITEKNFSLMAGKLRDVFALVGRGTLTTEQATKVLDENFGAFAKHVVETGKIASKEFTDLLTLQTQFGTQSKEITAFVSSEAGKLGQSFAKLLAPDAKSATDLHAKFEKSWDAFEKTAEERQKFLDTLGKKDKKDIGKDEQQALAKLEAAYTAAQSEMLGVHGEVDALATATTPKIERAGRLMAASFNAATKAGVPMLEAVDQLSPGLDAVLKTMDELGVSVQGSSVEWIVAFRERVNVNRELVDSSGSLNEIMLAMSRIGALNAETFADLQAQGVQSFEQLQAAGFSEQESLTMIAGFLEQARQAHAELGLPIDENTQKLIAQAEAQGVLKEQQLSTNDIMLQGVIRSYWMLSNESSADANLLLLGVGQHFLAGRSELVG